MFEIALTILAALLGGLLGGGGVVKLFLGALKNNLAEQFVAKAEMSGFSTRVTATETIARAANDAAGAAHSKALEVERQLEDRWDMTNERLRESIDNLNRAAGRFEAVFERFIRLEAEVHAHRTKGHP